MKSAILFLFLIACAQQISSPTILAVADCEKRLAGEACGCGCLEPAKCIQGTCLLTNLPDGAGCVENSQCGVGVCENGKCSTSSAVTVFDCEIECHRNDRAGCYTSCRDASSLVVSRQ